MVNYPLKPKGMNCASRVDKFSRMIFDAPGTKIKLIIKMQVTQQFIYFSQYSKQN